MDEVHLLFTSAGRRIELLRSFRKAYQGLGISGRIVATDIDPLAPALRMVDRPYLVPRLDSNEYIPALTEILRRERIGVVFPLIDPDVMVLAAHRPQLEATGARLAVVPIEAAQIAADKWRTHEFFSGLGLAVPKAWTRDQLHAIDVDFPLFIKPRHGSASRHTFRVQSREELDFFSRYVSDPIVQELVSGPEITNDVVCDFEGRVLSVVSRERIRVRSGEVLVGKTVYHPDVTADCVRIAEALRAIGPINVQCMMRGDTPTYIEVNARMGGGMPLGIAAGVDWPRWLLARAVGMPVDVPPLGSYRHGLYLSRFDDSAFISESERVRMASHRI